MTDEQEHWTTPLNKGDLRHLLDNHLFSKASFIMSRKYRQSFTHGNTEHCQKCFDIGKKLELANDR